MSMWKDPLSSKKDAPPAPVIEPSSAPVAEPIAPAPVASAPVAASTPAASAGGRERKESLIASDLTIEGKIEGSGHVRIAGRFKGDVNVQGDLTIEHGAKLSGGVKASKITIAGELEGNIDAAKHVELLASGALTGDVKCGTMTVAAGARMRGQADFGWDGSEKQHDAA